MFPLRATQKLLNVSRLKPDPEPENVDPISEWYANLYSTSFRGKFVVLFVHGYSKLPVLVKGKSLLHTVDPFLERLEILLIRKGIELEKRNKIIPTGEALILKTKSKSVLGHMNDYKQDLDFWFSEHAKYEDININRMEDYLSEKLIAVGKNVYDNPIDLLRKI